MLHSIIQLFRNEQIEIVGKDELISKDGWRLNFIGNSPATWRLLYAEKDKEITIAVECGVGGSRSVVWYVYLSKISGWGGEPFGKQERKKIESNIRSGMKVLKHVCKIV